ncbi:O-methyltransferase involved in polyketide biosynthesis [Allocatelliglobosispora scoriae]|uniref:O-methyltransferase involved in polyketide biosynthesis n=1 Tax=Allocatelliglobosispora scoriae TaxID=643052 RepID=A0A841BML2_9ACTN|nr:SAM-dependent methyltransferase [Allocatelliglobosispora scoriae]MBB5868905.1 O-methyltransferase involved in polyketide biosynthesis [Allocatelliglobosispora scoriae]
MERPTWASADVDLDRPSVARVYDYYLGGSHNFAVDREFAEKVLQAMPNVPRLARENRAFLRRAVRDLCTDGIDQFVDLGSGIPTEGNVHEVAQEINPEARVVYVDWDPVAAAHGQSILAGNDRTAVVRADLREPESVFTDSQLTRLIDPSKPTVVLLIAVLHFVPDDQHPIELIGRIASLLAPGSYLAISHASPEGQPSELGKAAALYTQTASPVTTRSQTEIAALFGGLDIIEPGVVQTPLWRPDFPDEVDPEAQTYPGFAGVARIG